MILDEIQKVYFRNNYVNEIGVVLEISKNTYYEMLKEDERLIKIATPNDNGEITPMFGRPVVVVPSDDFEWRWVKHES